MITPLALMGLGGLHTMTREVLVTDSTPISMGGPVGTTMVIIGCHIYMHIYIIYIPDSPMGTVIAYGGPAPLVLTITNVKLYTKFSSKGSVNVYRSTCRGSVARLGSPLLAVGVTLKF